MKNLILLSLFLFIAVFTLEIQAQSTADIQEQINRQTEEIFDEVVEWRRHFHEHPGVVQS